MSKQSKMKPLTPYDEGLNQRLKNPAFREFWEVGALRRAVTAAIMEERIKHRLTQEQFGVKIGWRQPNIARLESGRIGVSLETLEKIAQVFNKKVEIHFV